MELRDKKGQGIAAYLAKRILHYITTALRHDSPNRVLGKQSTPSRLQIDSEPGHKKCVSIWPSPRKVYFRVLFHSWIVKKIEPPASISTIKATDAIGFVGLP